MIVYDEIGSTLDVAHALAADGAPSGTLIIADAQTAGRGRMGRAWTSERGAGIWLTIVARPSDAEALDVLSLRVGIELAPALDAFAHDTVRLKWPNDLYVGDRKLGGILVEARWRDAVPEWVAIGVGINVRPPASEMRAAGLRSGVDRLAVLDAIVPKVVTATTRTAMLSDAEIRTFAARDVAIGRACTEPAVGVVQGIDARGSLLIEVASRTVAVRTGSLVIKEER